MDASAVLPFGGDAEWLLRHCKLTLHTGIGKIVQHGNPDDPFTKMFERIREESGQAKGECPEDHFEAGFLVPVDGNCVVILGWKDDRRLGKNFGEGMTITGESQDGPFRFICPHYYVKSASASKEQPGWAIASINAQAAITYGNPRPVARVAAIINNFDFEHGNVERVKRNGPGEVLRVEAAGRVVDFVWREERSQLRRLVDAGVIGTASFVEFSFDSWSGATLEELTDFAQRISTFCQYVACQHTGIPVLSFVDSADNVVQRTIGAVIQSKFREKHALRFLHFNNGLPQLFRQCFAEHCKMQESELWQRMPALFAAVEDPPYLEQKYATLMMAVELLIRSSLIEEGHVSVANANSKYLPELISLARGTLLWDIPRHYTRKERYRNTRNAVAHGNSLPHDIGQIRGDFDKWKLFLLRRMFIRLGFEGEVSSPKAGYASSSPVNEFSEEHNSFRDC
jgi:hypothetical protein